MKTTTWFKVSSTQDEPEAVAVIKETKAYITLLKTNTFGDDYTMRTAKRSSYENYFENEEEAWRWLLDHHRKVTHSAQTNYEHRKADNDKAFVAYNAWAVDGDIKRSNQEEIDARMQPYRGVIGS